MSALKSHARWWPIGALADRLRGGSTPSVCFCTLAVHAAYRERAHRLVRDVPGVPWVVMTDDPASFADLAVRAIRLDPTGPMAADFLQRLPPTRRGGGRPAYHDKRFVLQAALAEFESAIFVDADSRIRTVPRLPRFKPGIAVVSDLDASIFEHLSRWGQERLPAFQQLAAELLGDADAVRSARWCSEALFVVTRDGNEQRFLDTWARAAAFLHAQEVFTGEGGAIGLAAACAGWTVDYGRLHALAAATAHEGLGPKA